MSMSADWMSLGVVAVVAGLLGAWVADWRLSRRGRADLEGEVERAVTRTRQFEQRASHTQRVEALGRLTGGVAHDFNNLLGIVANSVELLRRLRHEDDRRMPLDAIQRATEAGSRLTRHLLRFAGRQPLLPAFVELRSYLPEAAELLRIVLGSAVKVSVEVAPETRPIFIDASELELALINLALNARDAMPTGGSFKLSARNAFSAETASLAAGPYVALEVADTGSGISPELRARVFEPFSTVRNGQGTGLGLAQVHGFCAQAGGTARLLEADPAIDPETSPAAGSRFLLLLPAPDSKHPASQDDVAATEPTQGVADESHRLLLVEDNDALGEVTGALLQSYGYRVERAAHAMQALERLEQADGRFDAVLSDIVMPGDMDGLALAEHLRIHRPDLPVVLLSGYSTKLSVFSKEGESKLGKSPHGDGQEFGQEFEVLHKPCSPQELTNALRRAIARRRPSA